MQGWDSTFRVRGWKRALGEWSVANATLPIVDLSKLALLPVLDVRGTRDRVIE